MKANDLLKDLRQKDKKGLQEELIALTREQFNLRMQRGTGQLANHTRLKKVRHTIAQVKTILKEMGGQN